MSGLKKRRYSLSGICLGLSGALLVLGAAEAMVRWDAMAPLFRIIVNLVSYGKLTAGEIWDAVRPEIMGCLYPLCAVLCALCGLLGLAAVLLRRRGIPAAAVYFAGGVLTLLAGKGTALKGLHLARALLLLLAGVLFALRSAAGRPRRRGRRPGASGEDGRLFAAKEGEGGQPPALPGAMRGGEDLTEAPRGGHLFSPKDRPALFDEERQRPPLFAHQNKKEEDGRREGTGGGKRHG